MAEQADSSNHKFTEITIIGNIRPGIDQTVVTEDNTDKIEVGLDTNKL